ncbi:MAG: hypothetical protein SFX73_09850 [Kofleriaceae bacterium]|nr:hypothetical protein [Kofleriaceae bacterium]
MGQPARRGLSLLFAVLPLGMVACAQIADIQETSGGGRSSLTMTRVSVGSTVERTPLDFSGLEGAIYLVDDVTQPDGLRRVPAQLSADAASWSAMVPTGAPVMFQLPDDPTPVWRIWAFPRKSVQGLFAVLEHVAPEPAPIDALFNVAVTLDTMYAAGETFAFANIGTWNTRAWTDTVVELPAEGAMMFTPPPFLGASLTKAPGGRAYEKMTTADTALALRYVGPKLTGVAEFPPFDQTGNDTLIGTMAAVVADQQLAIQVNPAAVPGRFAPLRPSMSAPTMSWALNAAPGWEIAAREGVALDSAAVIEADNGMITTLYGNPFTGKGWRAVFVWNTSASRSFTPMNQTLAVALGAGMQQLVEPASASTLDLPAPLPEVVQLDDTTLSTDGISIPQPTAPVVVKLVLGTGTAPTLYTLDLFEVVPNAANTALERVHKAALAGVAPELVLPPELLEPGKTYSLRATTVVGGYPGIADGDLTVRELPYASAYVDAGIFTVVAP